MTSTDDDDEFLHKYLPKKKTKRADEEPPKKKMIKKPVFSHSDLLRFQKEAADVREAITGSKTPDASPIVKNERVDEAGDDDEIVDLVKNQELYVRRENKKIFSFDANKYKSSAGEKILFIGRPPSNLKIIHDGHSDEETLFNAVALASSIHELNLAKTELRRILGLNSFKWKPKLEQFLAILSTVFGADLDRLLIGPLQIIVDLKNTSLIYGQSKLIDDDVVTDTTKNAFKNLNNLGALLEIFLWLNWEIDNESNSDIFTWIKLLLILSFDHEIRNRSVFKMAIKNILRRMFNAVSEKEIVWHCFCQFIRQSLIENLPSESHHYGLHLISLLPVDTDRKSRFRTSLAFEFISLILQNKNVRYDSDTTTIKNLIDLLEKGQHEKSDLFRDACTLSGLFKLIQFALSKSVINTAMSNDLDRLAIFFAPFNRRQYNDETTTNENNFSMVDSYYIRNIVSVILGKSGAFRVNVPGTGLFRFGHQAVAD